MIGDDAPAEHNRLKIPKKNPLMARRKALAKIGADALNKSTGINQTGTNT
ncbi:hypothetical protein [Caballeronia glebae]